MNSAPSQPTDRSLHEGADRPTGADSAVAQGSFQETMSELMNAHLSVKARRVGAVDFANQRDALLVKGLVEMGKSLGINLQVDRINSNGEMSVACIHPDGRRTSMGCGEFGEAFVRRLNRASPRTGIAPAVGGLIAESGWCMVNHFAVEKMLFDYRAEISSPDEGVGEVKDPSESVTAKGAKRAKP